jgi:hypothetical protein
MKLSTFIRQWCIEHGRSLEYQLPDGSSMPIDDDTLTVILAGIRFSPYVSASAAFVGQGALRQQRRPSTDGDRSLR